MLLIVYLLFIGLHVSKGCKLENSEQLLTITAHTGGSVLLPCSCTDLQTKPVELRWKKENRNTQALEEISRESDEYRSKVQLFNDHSPENLSLLISHLTEEDGGDYTCDVTGAHMIIRLTVKEGPNKPPPNAPTKPPTTLTTAPPPSPPPPTTTTTTSTRSTEKDNDTDHSIHFFILIPVLLLLLGLGGVIYWRYRGRRRGQTECQEQRKMKKDELKTQDDVMYSTVVHSTTPATDEVTYATVVHSSRRGTTPTVTDIGDKSEYATIQLNK